VKALANAILSAAVIVGAAATASAQSQPPLAPPQQPRATGAALSKIAVINTARFQTEVFEFKTKVDALNRQFETRVKEVQSIADKITALEQTLKTQSNVLTPARVAEQTEQLESMKKEYQRKAEDLQADASRTRDAAFKPISDKLGKFAEDYTKRKGITMLFDLANALQSGTIVWLDRRIDITEDFIAEYNKANPVPGAAPAPAAAAPPKQP
jgi:Skp family chaperone for outer membrane proteins